MAWWNEPAGDRTPPVTIDRVAAWFDGNDFTYDRREGDSAIVSGFDEYSYVVAIVDGNLLAIYARYWLNLPQDAEVTATLRDLLNTLNRSQPIPTLSTFVDEDGRQVGLAHMNPRHRGRQTAGGQEDVDAVIDDDRHAPANRPGDREDLIQEGAAVGPLGAQLNAGDTAGHGLLRGPQNAASPGTALIRVGDEIDRQVRCGSHACSSLTATASRSSAPRSYRASRNAGRKEPGPVERAAARCAAAL